MSKQWDKYAITKCPGCGAAVSDNRFDNMVKFTCGAEVFSVIGYKPSMACLTARLEALEARMAVIEAMPEIVDALP